MQLILSEVVATTGENDKLINGNLRNPVYAIIGDLNNLTDL